MATEPPASSEPTDGGDPAAAEPMPQSAGQPAPPPPPPSAQNPPPPPPPAAQAAPPPPPPPTAYGAGAGPQQGIPVFPDGKPMVDAQGRPASPRSRLAAALLAFFLGALGIHRFYVGKIGTGVLMIFTLGGLGLWVLIDFIVILVGSFKDKEERVLSNW